MKNLSDQEIEKQLADLEGWEYENFALETTFEFKNFKEAFSVMTRIAFECEALNHHPDWSNVYNTLHIRLSTHDTNGVTEKDFKLAHRIEEIIVSE
ncbi:4a-hydroxytetrahydrobiopterin dehydratase [Arenibacter nanhaiticus]|uniref:Putative pterin-4-alpha-carbinolamine dehydratase n=1 Tax=Arenibacter nanhaiticus TaxID=558155 RepID=A0A1M6LQM9_9FLAO|nr:MULTISPECIES: 4a-hydroxytetrahydrobiopterin dehydratase [Arenibacter]NKI28336.1 4a-hydroxytetrahydrobiopterin dehydratase [Arenibacter sp. 6A1]SHJ73470.1 4a-hydroxytetrahydrobiopterin dehydratase [Arenibacter nanhaiticus]